MDRPFPYPGCHLCGWQYPQQVIAEWEAGRIGTIDTNPTHLCIPTMEVAIANAKARHPSSFQRTDRITITVRRLPGGAS